MVGGGAKDMFYEYDEIDRPEPRFYEPDQPAPASPGSNPIPGEPDPYPVTDPLPEQDPAKEPNPIPLIPEPIPGVPPNVVF